MDIEQAKEKCKLGQGELCCAYLAFGNGFECLKGTTLEHTIKQSLLSGNMVAKGDYCSSQDVIKW